VKIGKTLGIGTGLVQRVLTEQPRRRKRVKGKRSTRA
jgi:hypothetical protein